MSKDVIHIFNPLAVGSLIANGQIGSAGQALLSDGNEVYWGSGFTGSGGGGVGSVGYTGSRGNVGFTGSRGNVGFTGSSGPVTSYIFDGGSPTSNYTLGPAFDCGGVL